MPRQYIRISEDFIVFIDYPFANYRKSNDSVTLDILGNPAFACSLILVNVPKAVSDKLTVEIKTDASYTEIRPVPGSRKRKYTLNGGSRIRLGW